MLQGGGLSWARNRNLAFEWSPAGSPPRFTLRLLDTVSSRDASAARVIVGTFANLDGLGRGFMWQPLVSADGSTVFATYTGPVKEEIVQISARTGGPVREILGPVRNGFNGPWCGVLWSDPSGRQVAAACGNDQPGVVTQGIVSDGQLQKRSLNLPVNFTEIFPAEDEIAW
jgi:hypothetical protein